MYRLGAVVRRSVVGCVYETEFGDDARPAVIKTRHAEPADAERQVAIWEEAIQLNHPNLLPIYAAGRSVMDDGPVCYAVMERADESLAGVLAERALSDAETREMLTPALAALQYLHKNGYAHSWLKTSNILAVGDQLRRAFERRDYASCGWGIARGRHAGAGRRAGGSAYAAASDSSGRLGTVRSQRSFADVHRYRAVLPRSRPGQAVDSGSGAGEAGWAGGGACPHAVAGASGED